MSDTAYHAVVIDLPEGVRQVLVRRWTDSGTVEVDVRESADTSVRWTPVQLVGGEFREEAQS